MRETGSAGLWIRGLIVVGLLGAVFAGAMWAGGVSKPPPPPKPDGTAELRAAHQLFDRGEKREALKRYRKVAAAHPEVLDDPGLLARARGLGGHRARMALELLTSRDGNMDFAAFMAVRGEGWRTRHLALKILSEHEALDRLPDPPAPFLRDVGKATHCPERRWFVEHLTPHAKDPRVAAQFETFRSEGDACVLNLLP